MQLLSLLIGNVLTDDLFGSRIHSGIHIHIRHKQFVTPALCLFKSSHGASHVLVMAYLGLRRRVGVQKRSTAL